MSAWGIAVWFDEDGRHIWLRHSHNGVETDEMLTTAWKARDGVVKPSIACSLDCGLHWIEAKIGPAPDDWNGHRNPWAAAQEGEQT